MYVKEELKRLERLHLLVMSKKTGTPDELACAIAVSRRQLYRIIASTKTLRAEIAYSKAGKTFYYKRAFDFEAAISL